MKDTKSLSHTSYRCKSHIVIVPKFRRMVIYNKLRHDIRLIITFRNTKNRIIILAQIKLKIWV